MAPALLTDRMVVLAVTFLVVGGIWLWNLWDYRRNPQRPAPPRWYMESDESRRENPD